MRVFTFDCWGSGMQIVESVQKCAEPNEIALSQNTINNLSDSEFSFSYTNKKTNVRISLLSLSLLLSRI